MSTAPLASILKSGPAMVVATLVGLGSVASVGWAVRGAISPAAAAEPSAVMRRLDKLDADILLIKCRLGIEGVCPPASPVVNAAAVGR
jgi:hypothetical protein